MWVRFIEDYDCTPELDRRRTVAFKRGMRVSVKRECGDAAIAAGKAEKCSSPRQEEAQNGDPLDRS